jgi:hypothetical protein
MDLQPNFEEWYRVTDGDTCPFCGAVDIDGAVLFQYGPDRIEELSCYECDNEWTVEVRHTITVRVNGEEFNV